MRPLYRITINSSQIFICTVCPTNITRCETAWEALVPKERSGGYSRGHTAYGGVGRTPPRRGEQVRAAWREVGLAENEKPRCTDAWLRGEGGGRKTCEL